MEPIAKVCTLKIFIVPKVQLILKTCETLKIQNLVLQVKIYYKLSQEWLILEKEQLITNEFLCSIETKKKFFKLFPVIIEIKHLLLNIRMQQQQTIKLISNDIKSLILNLFEGSSRPSILGDWVAQYHVPLSLRN